MAIAGKYYSSYLSTTGANEDLISKLETALSVDNMLVKKLTLITASDIHVSVNGNAYSSLYLNSDSTYALSLEDSDVAVNSLRVLEGSIASIFLAVIYV